LALNLKNENGVFLYRDSELPGFSGNPFDFAGLHYGLSGDDLLIKLNDELHLRIGEERNFYKQAGVQKKQPQINVPKFSLFRRPVTNIIPEKEITLVEAYLGIRSKMYADRTLYLRGLLDKNKARKYKAAEFDYVTFSGTFSKRSDKALLKHSGLLTIDFDHMSNIPELKSTLLNDPYFETELLFISPSGCGLKWITAIDLNECSHQEWFQAIAAYIKSTYQLEVDQSGKDISRACFIPYDPDVYINPIYMNTQKSENHEKE